MTRARTSLVASAIGWTLYVVVPWLPIEGLLRGPLGPVVALAALASFVLAAVFAGLALRTPREGLWTAVAVVVAAAPPILVAAFAVACALDPRGCFS